MWAAASWSDGKIRTLGGEMAHPWVGGTQRSLLVYHVAADGTRDRRTDTQPTGNDWARCAMRPTADKQAVEVACDASSLPDSGTVVAHIRVNADGKATVDLTGNVPTGNSARPGTRK